MHCKCDGWFHFHHMCVLYVILQVWEIRSEKDFTNGIVVDHLSRYLLQHLKMDIINLDEIDYKHASMMILVGVQI